MAPERSDPAGIGWARTPADFENLYTKNPDPWDYAGSWFECRKRQVTVACLPRERYRRCYEPGCSIGELTKVLAPRCDELLAVDCATAAVRYARVATRGFGHVRVERAVLPTELPAGSFDLIVLSELLYYLPEVELPGLLDGVLSRLTIGGDLVAVHARPRPGWDGCDLSHLQCARPELAQLAHLQDESFELDVLRCISH